MSQQHNVAVAYFRVVTLRRGEWREAPETYRRGERFELPRLMQAIAVDEIYDGILDASGRSLLA
jgi:hypothetical protein